MFKTGIALVFFLLMGIVTRFENFPRVVDIKPTAVYVLRVNIRKQQSYCFCCNKNNYLITNHLSSVEDDRILISIIHFLVYFKEPIQGPKSFDLNLIYYFVKLFFNVFCCLFVYDLFKLVGDIKKL